MTGSSYRVHVATDHEAWHEWLDRAPKVEGRPPHGARAEWIRQRGETLLLFAASGFMWVCPGCGGVAAGIIGEQPVSGWEDPRWVNNGTSERPTLTPSLGCPTWRQGDCNGHWWLRDGELIPARTSR